jgi:Serine carboxypeptidase S28
LAPAPHNLRIRDDVDPETLYPAHNFSVPIDHFHNDSRYEPHSSDTFNLRYFFDNTYYKPGGPVIILQSGETDATGRLPFLQKGIVAQLSKATNGLGVIIEHRYYGTSFPVDDLSTENLRFLTTQQAVADQAYFQKNIVFPGMEDMNLTAPGTPWIAYGGSYAGGFVAFLRKLYPESTWGAISSSGVTEAIYDYWQYYQPIIEYGPAKCVTTQQKLIAVMDGILSKNQTSLTRSLKTAFGMQDLTYDDDFAGVISDVLYGSGMIGWQGRNWDPALNSPDFDYYCANITSDKIQWPGTEDLKSNATTLIEESGWGNESRALITPMLNFIGYLNNSYVASCESTLDECYGSHNASAVAYTDRSFENQGAISWAYQ